MQVENANVNNNERGCFMGPMDRTLLLLLSAGRKTLLVVPYSFYFFLAAVCGRTKGVCDVHGGKCFYLWSFTPLFLVGNVDRFAGQTRKETGPHANFSSSFVCFQLSLFFKTGSLDKKNLSKHLHWRKRQTQRESQCLCPIKQDVFL